MTTSQTKRCEHCNVLYTYHPSTYGFKPEYNDSRYCQDCDKVIGEALATVPVKFKKKFVPTSDYTREEIISAQEKRCEKLPIHRIMMPLFDLTEPTNQQHNFCEMMKDPISGQRIYYSVTWWSKKPDEVEVCKEIWWDIINDCAAKYRIIFPV